MINNYKKIIKKIKKNKNIYNLFIKIGIQKKKFLEKKFLLNNCLINIWIKIIKKKFFFYFFGYSNSLLISGLIKIIFIIINKNYKKNIKIFFKFNIFKILFIDKKITNLKKETIKNIIFNIKNFINYN